VAEATEIARLSEQLVFLQQQLAAMSTCIQALQQKVESCEW